jgi:hypothetical protein
MKPFDDRAPNSPNAMPPIEIDPTVALTRPATIQAYEYWRSVSAGRAMPARKDISPHAMRTFMGHVGLVDRRPGEGGKADYVMRLAGARIEDIFGSITGRALADFLPPEIATRWSDTLDEAVAAGAPLRIAGRMATKAWLECEVLLAPLGEDGRISMLFGAIEVWPAVPVAAKAPAPA